LITNLAGDGYKMENIRLRIMELIEKYDEKNLHVAEHAFRQCYLDDFTATV